MPVTICALMPLNISTEFILILGMTSLNLNEGYQNIDTLCKTKDGKPHIFNNSCIIIHFNTESH